MVQIVEHHDDDGDAATRPVESCSPPQSVAAEEHKARGNACFARGEWEDAARHYTLALEAAPASTPEERKLDEDTIVERVRRRDRAVYLSNRAACRVKLGSHRQAEEDCTAAIAEDDTFVKAYLRRSAARERLDDLEGALADAERAAELVLHELPTEHLQADHLLREVLLHSLIQMTSNGRVSIGFSDGLRLTLLHLHLLDALSEAVTNLQHVLLIVQQLEVGFKVF